jgi:hypothetical protein
VANRCANGHAIAGNVFRKNHIVDAKKRDSLLAENLAEYQPDSLRLRRACRKLAAIEERLESTKEGTPEFARLVEHSAALHATLEASRPARLASLGIAAITDETTTEDLIARCTSILRALLSSAGEHRSPTTRRSEQATLHTPAAAPSEAAVEQSERAVETPVPPAPTAGCPYGCGTLARCAELRESRRETWAVLHWDDPVERERRVADATATMHRNIGKRSPWW